MRTAEHAPSFAPDYLIRLPHVEDAAEMGELHVAVWRKTYAGMMSDRALAQLDVSRFAGMWRRIAETSEERESSGNVTRIAQHLPTGALAGFATVGAPREQEAPVALQLWAINVLAAHQGSGVADRLLTATLGDRDAYLWVVEQNTRAQSFYRRHGFCTDGGRLRDDELGADEIRMVRLRSGVPCP